jgi:hypothetical protein
MAILDCPVVSRFDGYPAWHARRSGCAETQFRVSVTRLRAEPKWQCGGGGCQKMYIVAAHVLPLFGSPATSLKRSVALRTRLATGLPFSQRGPRRRPHRLLYSLPHIIAFCKRRSTRFVY